ncbi:MAG TPA: Nif3-like dinuclear metal center hexameric protein [Gaiellaceae bacterium]|nr:Nif3-like dinuclear metal center hexameric protein [Gaiellaceae bacterium]
MAHRDAILAFADELLDVASYPDFGPVGLQVVGAEEVTVLACGVSASRELFEHTAAVGAKMAIVHHGLFWDRDPRVVDGRMRGRLQALFAADITLAAYHLALDAHPELGNNALLARELGIVVEEPFDVGHGGSLAEPLSPDAFVARVRDVLGREPLAFQYGPDEIRRVAIVSGGAAGLLPQAAAAGYDAFLTGEPAEPTMMTARELGIHFVAGGHYATERLGVQALAKRLAEEFALDWHFIELTNPV